MNKAKDTDPADLKQGFTRGSLRIPEEPLPEDAYQEGGFDSDTGNPGASLNQPDRGSNNSNGTGYFGGNRAGIKGK